jgi:DNA polymerase elongation subunit (family B)
VSKPRVLLIDIETSPNLGYTWSKWKQNVIAFKQEWELLSFAFKEVGSKKIEAYSRQDFPTEGELVLAAWEVLDGADVLIGHNIDQFDNKKLRAKFVEHSLPPPSPYKTVDTKKIAKSQFAFNGNSLNDLAFTLKLGKKASTGGIDLWFGCMNGDAKSWKRMIDYNKQDVLLLEKVYERLKTWYPHHPNLALLANKPGCPVCGSSRVQRRGYNVLKTRREGRLHCQACGHWFSRSLSDSLCTEGQ